MTKSTDPKSTKFRCVDKDFMILSPYYTSIDVGFNGTGSKEEWLWACYDEHTGDGDLLTTEILQGMIEEATKFRDQLIKLRDELEKKQRCKKVIKYEIIIKQST